MADRFDCAKDRVLDASYDLGFYTGIAITVPTFPLTYSLAHSASRARRRRIDNPSVEDVRSHVTSGGISMAVGLGATAYTLLTRNVKPAAVLFGASAVAGLVNEAVDRTRDFRLPPA